MTNPYGSSAPEPPSAPGFGQPASSGSPVPPPAPGGPGAPSAGSSAPQYGGGTGMPPAEPPKKRWPLFVGIGCGCLALLAIGALVLALGLGALGGPGEEDPTTTDTTTTADQTTTDPATTDPATTDPATTDPATTDPATTDPATTDPATTPAATGPVSQEEADASKQRAYDFIMAVDSGDYETACGMMLNPLTQEPMTDPTMISGYAEGVRGEQQQTGQLAGLTVDMLEARPNDDGTVTISVAGTDFPYNMRKASDGQWYFDVPID